MLCMSATNRHDVYADLIGTCVYLCEKLLLIYTDAHKKRLTFTT